MTGSGATATVLSDKLSIVTHHHLLTRVPVKLDLDNWNYASLGSPVTNEDVASFDLEGLPDKSDEVCGIMHHRDTFLDLKIARSMLTTEEMRLKSKSLSLPVDSLSSSPLVLMVESSTNRRPSNPQVKSWRPCYNFAKGTCRFGNDCKFVHDTNAKPANTNVSQMSSNNIDELLVKLLDILD
ncbi:ribonuclease H-like domain-containing protein [Tanacetum coccineum]